MESERKPFRPKAWAIEHAETVARGCARTEQDMAKSDGELPRMSDDAYELHIGTLWPTSVRRLVHEAFCDAYDAELYELRGEQHP